MKIVNTQKAIDWLQSETWTCIFLFIFFSFEISLISLKSHFYFCLMFQTGSSGLKC